MNRSGSSVRRVARQIRAFSGANEASSLAYERVSLVNEPSTSQNAGDAGKAIILHGLLGSGRNWRSFSRQLANEAASSSNRPWDVFLVDQRCHGRSTGLQGLNPPHTLAASAKDVINLMARQLGGPPDVLIGHSLGGKIVLELISQLAKGKEGIKPPRQVWVLDSAVGKAKPGVEEPTDVGRVLREIRSVKLPIKSRDALYTHLESRGFSAGFRLWMGSNLTLKSGQYTWAFDVDGAAQLYESYQESSYYALIEDPPPGTTLNIVRASNSDRWSKRSIARLEAAAEKGNAAGRGGQVKLHVLPDAGHWLHADNPDGLRQMLLQGFAPG